MTPQQLRAQALAAKAKRPLPDTPENVCSEADLALRALVDIMNGLLVTFSMENPV
jgi:hypothetical protein